MKYLFIDNKIRDIEYNYLKSLNYEIILIPTNLKIYDEISSHTDIHICKIKDKVIVSKEIYEYLNNEFFSINKYLDLKDKIIKGDSYIIDNYPLDVKYNIFQFNKYVVHNFKYTDLKCLDIIEELDLEKIDVNQGYSNCSCLNILDKVCITSDIDIYNKLINKIDNKNINIVYIDKDKCDIKLLKNYNKEYINNIMLYSAMKGFVGGCMSYIDNKLILFGDSKYIYNFEKIKSILILNNIEIIEFKNIDLIDYGKIIEV